MEDKKFKYILLYTHSYEEDRDYRDSYREFYKFSDLMNYLLNEIPKRDNVSNIKIYEIKECRFSKYDDLEVE